MASKAREKSQPPDKQRGALERSGTVLTWGSWRSARDDRPPGKERRLQHRCGPWPCPAPSAHRVPCPLRLFSHHSTGTDSWIRPAALIVLFWTTYVGWPIAPFYR